MNFDYGKAAISFRLIDTAGGVFELFSLRAKRPSILIFVPETVGEIEAGRITAFASRAADWTEWGALPLIISRAAPADLPALPAPFRALDDRDGKAHRLYGVEGFGVAVLDRYTAPLAARLDSERPISAAESLDLIRASELACSA